VRPTLSDASVELVILVIGDDYHTILKKDGVVVERKCLATEQQVMACTSAIMELVGQNLYVRLRSAASRRRCELLHLATRLSRQGMTVGLDRHPSDCRFLTERIQ